MPYQGDGFFVLTLVLYAGLSVAMAWLSYRWVELPFLRIKRRLGGNFDATRSPRYAPHLDSLGQPRRRAA
jgi:peptidoglycan/LPS O-acetylase OafA/YrhL